MLRLLAVFAVLALASPAFADDKEKDKPKPKTLTPKEIADGWLLLFDGESTFGWKTNGDVKVENGVMVINGEKAGAIRSTAEFPFPSEIVAEFSWSGKGDSRLRFGGMAIDIPKDQWTEYHMTVESDNFVWRAAIKTRVPGEEWKDTTNKSAVKRLGSYLGFFPPKEAVVSLRSLKVRPLEPKPLFTGKNLDGWKINAADPKRMASKWEVTKEGELSLKNGPGDLVTEKEFDNFVLQLECKTLGKALNSGVFFRCIPEQYQNGYEAQIHNGFKDDDRTKPTDFGTGAIYRRIAARKVVANDNEWFTMTVVANGKHFATWVNGYQTVDWTDDRKENENPRNGFRATKGPISIQGHDPTTDILFRNIRIAELPAEKKKD